jgi:hypothetical protein
MRLAAVTLLALLSGVVYAPGARDRPLEFILPFAVPPVTKPHENGECRMVPSFAKVEKDAAAVQAFFPSSDSRAPEVVSLVWSTPDKVTRGVRVDVPDFWETGIGTASCLSQCVRFPEGVVLSQLTLSYSDGAESCLIKPLDNRTTPTLVGIVCQDSAWPEVLVQPGPRPVVCATAMTSSQMGRPTKHRLVLKYR